MAKVSFYKDDKTEISVDEKKHGKYYAVTIKTTLNCNVESLFSNDIHLKLIGYYTTKGFGFDAEEDYQKIKSESENIVKAIYSNNERKLNRNLKKVNGSAKVIYKILDFHKTYHMKHPEIIERDVYICYALPENKKEEQKV